MGYFDLIESTIIEEVICEGQVFEIGGFSFMDEYFGELQLTAANGCDSIIDLSLLVTAPEQIKDTMTLCPDEVFEWMGQTISSDGLYSDTIVDMSGCLVYHDLLVEIDDYVEIEALIRPYSSEEKGRIELLVDPDDELTVLWNSGEEGLVLENLDPGFYEVMITDQNGCIQVRVFEVERVKEELEILLANVFSPESQNQTNRYLIPSSNDPNVKFTQMIVFDRWGNFVFDCNSPGCLIQGWDGRFNGRTVAQGVYSIKLVYEHFENIDTEYRTVTIL